MLSIVQWETGSCDSWWNVQCSQKQSCHHDQLQQKPAEWSSSKVLLWRLFSLCGFLPYFCSSASCGIPHQVYLHFMLCFYLCTHRHTNKSIIGMLDNTLMFLVWVACCGSLMDRKMAVKRSLVLLSGAFIACWFSSCFAKCCWGELRGVDVTSHNDEVLVLNHTGGLFSVWSSFFLCEDNLCGFTTSLS